jgi:hypothetical protein
VPTVQSVSKLASKRQLRQHNTLSKDYFGNLEGDCVP